MFNPTPDTLSEAQRGVLEVANCVAFDVLATRTGTDALRGLARAARILTNARYAAIGVARPGAAHWSEFVATGATPESEALFTPLLWPNELLEPDGHPAVSSFLSVPIRRGDNVLGALYLCNKEGDDFSGADEIIMRALCAHAAVAVFHLEMVEGQRALVRGLMLAQEEERRAVAYDLHDGLTQYVMAAHAHLQGFQAAQKSGKTGRAAQDLEQGLKLLQEAVVESRRLVNGLRLLALDDLGLAGALEQLLVEERARAGWTDATFTHNLIGRRFDETLETAIYRVAQEALTNARRHAKATQVRVLLLEEAASTCDARLRLEVRDWGCGFDPAQNFGPGHFGLHGVLERVHILEGTYQLRSAPGQGTTLCASFPANTPASGVGAKP
jgi:signal transduction histidine kinase